ncbi:MAG: hypothetical protein JKY90_07085 [Gammaproteobacteria bacterium]|nr:hypothetical protein [Gammaproteobacteria bacterium]
MMILQTMAFSSAMANMDSMQTESMAAADTQQAAEMASPNCPMSLAEKSNNINELDNCCNAATCPCDATCYSVYLSAYFFQIPILSHSVIAVSTYSFTNVDVSVQTRPPKYLPV